MTLYKVKFIPNDQYTNSIKELIASDRVVWAYKHGLDMSTKSGKKYEYMLLNINLCCDESDFSEITKVEVKDL